jgi:uncharacterized membrane protein YpjA
MYIVLQAFVCLYCVQCIAENLHNYIDLQMKTIKYCKYLSFLSHFSMAIRVIQYLGSLSMEIWKGILCAQIICSRKYSVCIRLDNNSFYDGTICRYLSSNAISNVLQIVKIDQSHNHSLDRWFLLRGSICSLWPNILYSVWSQHPRTIGGLVGL